MNTRKKVTRKFFVGMVAAALSINVMAATAFAADTGSHIGTAATTYTNPNKTVTVDGVKDITPDSTDRAKLRVFGIDDPGAEVIAYHVLEANYNEFGLTGYTQTKATYEISDAAKIAGFDKVTSNSANVIFPDDRVEVDGEQNPDWNGGKIITEQNISHIANGIVAMNSNKITFTDGNTDTSKLEAIKLTYNATTGAFETDKAEAGSYIVLVRKTTDGVRTVYNPMIVSNDYIDANDATSLGKDIEVRTGVNENTGAKEDYSHGFVGADGKRYRNDIESNDHVYIANNIGDVGAGDANLDGKINDSDKNYLSQVRVDPSKIKDDRTISNGDLNMNGKLDSEDEELLSEYITYLSAINGKDPVKDYKAIKAAENNLSDTFKKDVLNRISVETMALQGRAYAKKDTIPFEKNIVKASTAKGLTDIDYSKYDDLRITKDGTGEVTSVAATFDLFAEVPDYSDIYYEVDDDFVYEITDTLSEGLTPVKTSDVKVYVGHDDQVPTTKSNPTYAEDVAKYLIGTEDADGQGTVLTDGVEYKFVAVQNDDGTFTFKLQFDKDWITSEANAHKKIVIRYSTYLNDKAVKGLDGNPNDAKLQFTTVPHENTIIHDWTTHYTFPVWVTKVKENGEVEVKEDVIHNEDIPSDLDVKYPLAGAKFRLVKVKDINLGENGKELITDAVEKYTWTATSDDEGIIRFDTGEDGLDEGIYAMVEYEAPKGYTLNDKVYLVKISAEYDTTKQRSIGKDLAATEADHRFINKFVVTVFDDGATGTDFFSDTVRADMVAADFSRIDWTKLDNDLFLDIGADASRNSIVYEWADKEGNGEKDVSVVATAIPNTPLSRLPSTGGIGTILFTVAGVGAMSAAFLLMRKSKDDEEEAESENA